MDPIDEPLANFETVAGHAAGFELTVRMVADLTAATDTFLTNQTLETTLVNLNKSFEKAIPHGEWDNITLARKIRNKLFHGELHQASSLIKAPSGGVVGIKLSNNPTISELLNKIDEARSGKGKLVYETTTAESGVHGWLLEVNNSGALKVMLQVFLDAKASLLKLAKHINRIE